MQGLFVSNYTLLVLAAIFTNKIIENLAKYLENNDNKEVVIDLCKVRNKTISSMSARVVSY